MKKTRIHPLGVIIIVIWCAIAVISQNMAAAQNEATSAKKPEQQVQPKPEQA